MSRWIDAEWLSELFPDTGEGDWTYNATALGYIDSAPSLNLVRCAECKKAHLTYDGKCKYCDEWKDDDGNYIEVYHDGNHFCSYGVRKENE